MRLDVVHASPWVTAMGAFAKAEPRSPRYQPLAKFMKAYCVFKHRLYPRTVAEFEAGAVLTKLPAGRRVEERDVQAVSSALSVRVVAGSGTPRVRCAVALHIFRQIGVEVAGVPVFGLVLAGRTDRVSLVFEAGSGIGTGIVGNGFAVRFDIVRGLFAWAGYEQTRSPSRLQARQPASSLS